MIESDNQFLVCSIYNYLLAVSLIIFTEVFFPAALASAAQEADEYDNKVIHAIRINERIKLDGILNDSVWQSVEPTTDLVQREPVEGQQPLQKTEVRFLYDYAALYIGVICHDSEPEKIVHNELVRDGAVMYDDNFLVMLDTYSNKRTGWYFCINPNGAKLDAVVTGFKEFSTDWDGVWYGEAKMLTDGWSAEIAIPFSTLRFPNTEKQIWGINFCRVLPRDNFIQDIWSSWHLNDGMTQLTKAGKLVGIEGITGSRQMDFVPYVSGAQERLEGKARDLSLKYGADIKYGITSNLTLTLTTHTDFAQAEADEEQINLTRFSIYYPEKRSFFLESGEIFSFAEGEKQSTIFYSRTIGLTTDRELVPILAGGKLAGKANGYEIGVLSMQTKEKSGYPSSNYSVFRLKRNFLRKSFVGIMATNLSENGDNRNQAVGMDYAFKTDSFMENKNLEIDGYLAGTSTEGLSGDNLSGKIKIRLPNDLFDYYSLYRFVEPNFNPEIGYVKRPGIRKYFQGISFTPRTSSRLFKKLKFTPIFMDYATDMDGRLLERLNQITLFGFESTGYDTMELKVVENYDAVDIDFPIFKTTKISRGSYQWWNGEVIMQTSSSRRFSLNSTFDWGDFYNGRRTLWDSEWSMKIDKYIQIAATGAYTRASFNDRSIFIAREYGLKFHINMSTALTTSTFIQWNNEYNEARCNFRLRFIPREGSNLYIVYNGIWDESRDFRNLENIATLKVDYLYRF